MKRAALVRLPALLAVLLLLTSCGSLLNRDYSSVSRHISQRADTEDASVLRVETYSDLVNSVQYFVSLHAAEGTVHLYQYPGDVEQDLQEACDEVLGQDPLGSYALRDIRWDSSRIVSYYECTFTFRYRRSAEQVASIRQTTGTVAIRDVLGEALAGYEDTLVLQTSTYYAQKDRLYDLLQEAYYDDPAHALGLPDMAVTIYPQDIQGGTQRIVELQFTYSDGQATLLAQAEAVAQAAATLAGPSPAQGEVGYWLLYSRLGDLVTYDAEASPSVHAALVDGSADSEGIALAYQLLCQRSGLTCQLIQGTLDGSPHWWNLVELEEDLWRHVDVTAGLEQGQFLCTDSQIAQRYTWDAERYPACPDSPEEDAAPDSSDTDAADGQEEPLSEAAISLLP